MKTMIARYPGTCAECGQPIRKGDTINFFGRGHAEHAKCLSLDSTEGDEGDEDRAAGFEPGTLASSSRDAVVAWLNSHPHSLPVQLHVAPASPLLRHANGMPMISRQFNVTSAE